MVGVFSFAEIVGVAMASRIKACSNKDRTSSIFEGTDAVDHFFLSLRWYFSHNDSPINKFLSSV